MAKKTNTAKKPNREDYRSPIRRNISRVLAATAATMFALILAQLFQTIRLDARIETLESARDVQNAKIARLESDVVMQQAKIERLEFQKDLLKTTVKEFEKRLEALSVVSNEHKKPVQANPTLEISVMIVPPKGVYPDKGKISGSITGGTELQDFGIVIYSHTDNWYVQPSTAQPVTRIVDGRWESTIYLGDEYLVLLVHKSYEPLSVITYIPGPDDRIVDAEIFPGEP